MDSWEVCPESLGLDEGLGDRTGEAGAIPEGVLLESELDDTKVEVASVAVCIEEPDPEATSAEEAPVELVWVEVVSTEGCPEYVCP